MTGRFTYSVLIKRKGKFTRFSGLYNNIPVAREHAKSERGKVIRFKNNPDGSVLIYKEGARVSYVVLRGKL